MFDVGTLDLMLSDAYYPANKLMADNGYQVYWNNYFPGIRAYYATSKGDMYSLPFNSSMRSVFADGGRSWSPLESLSSPSDPARSTACCRDETDSFR